MAISTGFDAVFKILTASTGTCTVTSDQLALTIGTCTAIGAIDNYTMSNSNEEIDITAFGDKLRKKVLGFPNYSITLSGSFNYADTSQKAIWDLLVTSGAQTARVYRIHESGAIHTIKAYCKASSSGSSVGGRTTFSAELMPVYIPKTCTKA